MPSKKDAAYYRDYRARKAVSISPDVIANTLLPSDAEDEEPTFAPMERVRELEEEVRHLKRQLAEGRPVVRFPTSDTIKSFNSRPFTPVPKTGKK